MLIDFNHKTEFLCNISTFFALKQSIRNAGIQRFATVSYQFQSLQRCLHQQTLQRCTFYVCDQFIFISYFIMFLYRSTSSLSVFVAKSIVKRNAISCNCLFVANGTFVDEIERRLLYQFDWYISGGKSGSNKRKSDRRENLKLNYIRFLSIDNGKV